MLYPQIPSASRPWQKDPSDNRALLAKAHAAGFRWTYIWVAWSDIERQEGAYSWQQLDDYVRLAHDTGMNLVVQVMIGAWGSPQPWTLPTRVNSSQPSGGARLASAASTVTPLPVDLTGVRRFWTELVSRYRPAGTLAMEEGWGDDYGVRVWEVENEPDTTPWWGRWTKVPKDYAEYLAEVVPAVRAVDPNVIISGPSLAQEDEPGPAAPIKGLPWFREMLTPGTSTSDYASDTYRSNGGREGGGAYIDEFSFHFDLVTVGDGAAPDRAEELRSVAAQHVGVEPESLSVYYSEGGANQYSGEPTKFAWAQQQLMVQLLAAGVDRMVFELGAEPNTNPWESSPLYKASRTITTYFPRAGQVVRADDEVDPHRVTTFRRTDPSSGLRTYVLWAHDLARGSSDGPGDPFTVTVPVRTESAEVVDADWDVATVPTDGHGVEVTLYADDPSPVVVVAEVSAPTRLR